MHVEEVEYFVRFCANKRMLGIVFHIKYLNICHFAFPNNYYEIYFKLMTSQCC